MEQEMNKEDKKHVCDRGGCCSTCCGCNCHKWGMNKGYWARRWIALIIGVLLAFWVGMKLGEIKGYMHSFGPGMGHRGMMMRVDYRDQLVQPKLLAPAPTNQ